jgi:pyruvate carboxylase
MTSNSFSKKDVIERAEHLDFPSSVVEFFQGYLGQPVGGFPEPLRSRIIRNKPKIDGRPGTSLSPLDFKKIKADLRSKFGKHITDSDVTSYVMYPKVSILSCLLFVGFSCSFFSQVFEEYQGFVERYGDLRCIESTSMTFLNYAKAAVHSPVSFPLVTS